MGNWKNKYPGDNDEKYADHFFGPNASHETFLKALFGEDLGNPINQNYFGEPLANANLIEFAQDTNNQFLINFKKILFNLAFYYPELAFGIKEYTGINIKPLIVFGEIQKRNGSFTKRGVLTYETDNSYKVFRMYLYGLEFNETYFFQEENGRNRPEREPNYAGDVNPEGFDDNLKKLLKKRYSVINHSDEFAGKYPGPYFPAKLRQIKNNSRPDSEPDTKSKTNTNTDSSKIMQPLNQILYGPPGTGKTHKTAELAVNICEPKFLPEGDTEVKKRESLMGKYKELATEGFISFVTFHQSYGYEEFVEGLRPILSTEKETQTSQSDASQNLKGKKPETGDVQYEIKKGIFFKMCKSAREDTEDKNYVLIIDEINRGNISKIFGELITLIEEDKRDGKENSFPVTLPYSQKSFCVPSNLYIIGTMNTADRSLALLDTALRRRFHFVPMMPDSKVLTGINIKGIDIEKLLYRINERIEVLYDREHMIGHAFFTTLKKINDDEQKFDELKNIFANKIMPLLEEYFFDDWKKIAIVLGKKIISKKNPPKTPIFEPEHRKLINDNEEIYELIQGALDDPESYINIYKENQS